LKRDLRNRKDLQVLVELFYATLVVDEIIGHFFTEVVIIDFEKHIPHIIDFWESVLFGTGKYKGNPIKKHIDLHRLHRITAGDFNSWLNIWNRTINKLYSGPKATEAVQKATTMKTLMLLKIEQSDNPNFIA